MSDCETPEEQADRLSGLFAGQCQREEYQHLIDAGLLRKTYEGATGLLGLARLVRVMPDTTP